MSLLIHEVAQQVGVHVDTIRRLERRGIITSKRDVNGWRRYGPDVVETLKQFYLKGQEHPRQGKEGRE